MSTPHPDRSPNTRRLDSRVFAMRIASECDCVGAPGETSAHE